MRSSLIYKFSCCGCNATYLGATTRHLKTRISEHLGVSHRTNAIISNPNFSAIREHSHNSGHPLHPNDFKIFYNVLNKNDIYIIESILINLNKPLLNSGTSAELKVFC